MVRWRAITGLPDMWASSRSSATMGGSVMAIVNLLSGGRRGRRR
jgi:hypothetical protein